MLEGVIIYLELEENIIYCIFNQIREYLERFCENNNIYIYLYGYNSFFWESEVWKNFYFRINSSFSIYQKIDFIQIFIGIIKVIGSDKFWCFFRYSFQFLYQFRLQFLFIVYFFTNLVFISRREREKVRVRERKKDLII